MPDLELVSVAYHDRSFPEHRHEEFVIGAITGGAESLTTDGTQHVAAAGAVLHLLPGQAHSNATVGFETLRYSVLYIPAQLLARYGGATAGEVPRFAAPVISDPRLHSKVCAAHTILASTETGCLEQESAFSSLAYEIYVQCSDVDDTAQEISLLVGEARAYIDANIAEDFGLAVLSSHCGASCFHLARSFKRELGISPLAYRNQQRLAAARRLLREGHATVDVALALGYADQSHFTRHFQRVVGTSPARYARDVI